MYVIYPNLDFWFKNLPTIWQPCIWKRKKMAAFSGQKNVERMRLFNFFKFRFRAESGKPQFGTGSVEIGRRRQKTESQKLNDTKIAKDFLLFARARTDVQKNRSFGQFRS
jgi:hypothetical protein